MKSRFLYLLCALFLAGPLSCLAVTSFVTVALLGAYGPLEKRVPEFVIIHHDMGGTNGPVGIQYRGVELDAERKAIGPTERGFILEAHTVSNLGDFKPTDSPFVGKKDSLKEAASGSTEFHIFSIGPGFWLVVSIWCGPSVDREVVREVLTVTSKSADEMRQFVPH